MRTLCLFFSDAYKVVLTLVVHSKQCGFFLIAYLKDFVLYFNNIQWKIEYLHKINLHQITRGILSSLAC